MHTHPSLRASPFPSSTSPTASLEDPFSYYTSDTSYMEQAYTPSTLAEESLDLHTCNANSLDSVVYSDTGWELSGMPDDCGHTTQSPLALEHSWSSLGEASMTISELAFGSSNFWDSDPLEPHVAAALSPCSIQSSHLNTLSSWHFRPWSLSYSIPESPHCETSSCARSPTSLRLGEHNIHHFHYDSAVPCMTTIQYSDSQASTSPLWQNFLPGSLEENHHNPSLSEMYGATHDFRDVESEAQTCHEAASQPDFDVDSIEGTDPRSACSRCLKKFSHSADLTRHMKTQHNAADRGYRCAFPGCPKVHKVWSRLDSFKKHVRQRHLLENAADINDLVKRSATGFHGLPVAMTSFLRHRSGSSASRVRHSVSL
jgi:hypothetical protein